MRGRKENAGKAAVPEVTWVGRPERGFEPSSTAGLSAVDRYWRRWPHPFLLRRRRLRGTVWCRWVTVAVSGQTDRTLGDRSRRTGDIPSAPWCSAYMTTPEAPKQSLRESGCKSTESDPHSYRRVRQGRPSPSVFWHRPPMSTIWELDILSTVGVYFKLKALCTACKKNK